MNSGTDVVVVGAGMFGLSAAHHLTELGLSVRVLERDTIAGATSTCAAGFIGRWAAGMIPELGPQELRGEEYANEFYTNLHEDRPHFEFRAAGMVFIALDEPGWDRYIKPIDEASANTVEGARRLDPEEAAELTGVLDPDNMFAAVYHPGTVQISARDAGQALAGRLGEQGVRIDEHTPVTELLVHSGQVTGVRTMHGEELHCERVIVAAAMWTNSLLVPHAAPLPYAPMGALRITTGPLGIPGSMPMLMVTQVGAWIREEAGALRWGCLYRGAHRDALLDIERPPDRIQGMPIDGLRETLKVGERLAPTVPPLGRCKNFTYIEGYPCYTPDKRSLVGAVPEVEGLYAMTGDSENGVTHAPMLGRGLAQMIVGQRPEADMTRYRLDRFRDEMPRPTPRQVAAKNMERQRIFG